MSVMERRVSFLIRPTAGEGLEACEWLNVPLLRYSRAPDTLLHRTRRLRDCYPWTVGALPYDKPWPALPISTHWLWSHPAIWAIPPDSLDPFADSDMIFNPQLSASPLNLSPGVRTEMKWSGSSAESPLTPLI